MTKKLENTDMSNIYNNVLQHQLMQGIINLAPEVKKNEVHYVPNRGDIRKLCLSTNLKPVFDASTKFQRGNTLNSCLEKGPNTIKMIRLLLIRIKFN